MLFSGVLKYLTLLLPCTFLKQWESDKHTECGERSNKYHWHQVLFNLGVFYLDSSVKWYGNAWQQLWQLALQEWQLLLTLRFCDLWFTYWILSDSGATPISSQSARMGQKDGFWTVFVFRTNRPTSIMNVIQVYNESDSTAQTLFASGTIQQQSEKHRNQNKEVYKEYRQKDDPSIENQCTPKKTPLLSQLMSVNTIYYITKSHSLHYLPLPWHNK